MSGPVPPISTGLVSAPSGILLTQAQEDAFAAAGDDACKKWNILTPEQRQNYLDQQGVPPPGAVGTGPANASCPGALWGSPPQPTPTPTQTPTQPGLTSAPAPKAAGTGVAGAPTVELLAGLSYVNDLVPTPKVFSGAPTAKAQEIAGTGGLVPASALWVGLDDQIAWFIYGNVAPQTLELTIRILDTQGNIKLITQELQLTSNNLFPQVNFRTGAGWILSCEVQYSAEAVFENYVYAAVYVINDASATGVPHAQLLAGYVDQTLSRIGTDSRMRDPLDGPGTPVNADFADLTSPGDTNFSARNNACWKLMLLAFELDTDATAGNRQMQLRINDPHGYTIYECAAVDVVGPNAFQKMFFGVGLPYTKDKVGNFLAPLPADMRIHGNGCQISTQTTNLGAADVFATATAHVIEWAYF